MASVSCILLSLLFRYCLVRVAGWKILHSSAIQPGDRAILCHEIFLRTKCICRTIVAVIRWSVRVCLIPTLHHHNSRYRRCCSGAGPTVTNLQSPHNPRRIIRGAERVVPIYPGAGMCSPTTTTRAGDSCSSAICIFVFRNSGHSGVQRDDQISRPASASPGGQAAWQIMVRHSCMLAPQNLC